VDEKRVNATHRSCRFRPPAGRPRVVAGGAGPQVSSVLGVFRRPPTEEERALGARLPDAPSAGLAGGAAPPREGVRLVRAPSGRAIVLTALRDVPPLGPTRKTFDRCQALVAAELARLARSAPRDVAAPALRLHCRLRRAQRPPAVRVRGEGLTMSERARDGRSSSGGGIAPFDAATFAARGTGMASFVRGLGSRVTLIVLDGVATIEATFPRVRSRGRFRAPKRYRTTLRRTLTVHDNVAFATVARSPEDAFPRMVWRAADGSVVRRVNGP
jgi:hypothetical protein